MTTNMNITTTTAPRMIIEPVGARLILANEFEHEYSAAFFH